MNLRVVMQVGGCSCFKTIESPLNPPTEAAVDGEFADVEAV